MAIKVFKMNDCDTVISPLSKEETNEWYKKEFGLFDEEQKIEDVTECDLSDGYWSELNGLSDIEELEEGGEMKIKKFNGCYFEFITFQDAIESFNTRCLKVPEIICSTEW